MQRLRAVMRAVGFDAVLSGVLRLHLRFFGIALLGILSPAPILLGPIYLDIRTGAG